MGVLGKSLRLRPSGAGRGQENVSTSVAMWHLLPIAGKYIYVMVDKTVNLGCGLAAAPVVAESRGSILIHR